MSESLTEQIKKSARELGFELVGIAPAISPVSLPHFESWVEAGYAGDMKYIPGRREAYQHPRHILPVVRSVIMTAMCYDPQRNVKQNESRIGQIARYARGEKDYHDVMKVSLKTLAQQIHEEVPDSKTRAVVDTTPLLERDFAQQAGLGWFGKNTMLLNKSIGSYFFLGALLTDVELTPDEPHNTSHCGTCTICLDACPTDAFVQPYILNATRCISYYTIEMRDQSIPEEIRPGLKDWMFGCDICQEVCPWNRKAPPTREEKFESQTDLPDAIEFLTMSPETFKAKFRGTPLERTGRNALARNAAIVIGNSGSRATVQLLIEALQDESPLVREAVVWALGKLGNAKIKADLQSQLSDEKEELVVNQLKTSISQLDRNSYEIDSEAV
ncbi:tRNA epoxyqueuosine(34) reductase QueG [Rubinisphaera sp.]|uniref:tRNA epoxyqueuosine(34) reductase QueG n=1 Tax=Rubinisphaera sp. TaxID=2024857 RepID=UPI000C11340B|nr:tRNA epoxyqueuosine(34) reductase QueG [Rubinisphaera sp.]MBV07819.1 tRNA epoxyqueuosine(34) reductase QueG [Rubinisphaera sp.]HCS53162.1 tRNA epoxyqueuosine(34) reductase QueG [Planctomycetaceae bacterium]|tara:strand:+ start:10414 stop:11571 length:1158 start_codon:yes stop_codon:yes gene_type:complete